MSTNPRPNAVDESSIQRHELLQRIRILPPKKAAAEFKTLVESYSSYREKVSNWVPLLSKDGVFDLAMDLMDPKETTWNSHAWLFCLPLMKLVTDYLVNQGSMADLAAGIKCRLGSFTERVWKFLVTSGGTAEGEVIHNEYLPFLSNMLYIYKDDQTFYQELRGACGTELAMFCWATPAAVHRVPPSDQASYYTHCFEIFRRVAFVSSIEEAVANVTVSEERPKLPLSAIQVCENTGTQFYEKSILKALRHDWMLDIDLFMALEMINGYFLVESMKVQYLHGPVICRILNVLETQLESGKDRQFDGPIFQAALTCFHTVLSRKKSSSEPPAAYEDALRNLRNQTKFITFLAKTILVVTQAERVGSVSAWADVAHCLYGDLKSDSTVPSRSSSPYISPETRRSVMDIWYDVYLSLNLIDPTNPRKLWSIELWKQFAWKFGLDEATIIQQHLQTLKKIRQKGAASLATIAAIGCGWSKCPLWGVETLSEPLVCSKCRKVFYCSEYCQERDWGNHQKQCKQVKR